jgi:hypothetical protein
MFQSLPYAGLFAITATVRRDTHTCLPSMNVGQGFPDGHVYNIPGGLFQMVTLTLSQDRGVDCRIRDAPWPRLCLP